MLFAMWTLVLLHANAQVDASIQELMDNIAKSKKFEPGSWVDKVKAVNWHKPPKTGDKETDAIFDRQQEYYDIVKTTMDELVFYDVKLLKDTSTGDMFLAVVDENNVIRDKKKALEQYKSVIPLFAAEGIETGNDVIETGKDVIKTTKDVIETGKDVIETGINVISSIFTRKKTDTPKPKSKKSESYENAKKKAEEEFSRLRSVVRTDVKAEFEQQRTIIQAFKKYIEESKTEKESEIVQVPESNTIPPGIPVIEKSTEEIIAELDALGV